MSSIRGPEMHGGETCGARPDAGGELARSVAARLHAEISAGQLQPGARLGRAAELMQRFHVSRPTLRIAIRQLEADALVTTRPGVGGGLFVLDDAGPGALALSRHISLLGLPYRLFFQIHMPFFEIVAVLAAARAGAAERRDIAAKRLEIGTIHRYADYSVARPHLRKLIMAAAANPALEVIGAALTRAYQEILRGELRLGSTEQDKVRQVKAADDSVVAALVRGDEAETRRCAQTASEIERAVAEDTIRCGMLPERGIPQTLYGGDDEARSAKLADQTARALRRTIHVGKIQPGSRLGSVPELSSRLGVSCDICREALSLIEPCGLISLRRGRGGGVYVGLPDARRLLSAVRGDLLQGDASSDHLREAADTLDEVRRGVAAHPEFAGEADAALQLLDELTALLRALAAQSAIRSI
ncbi:MAG: GntR family transcriptional regulator [Caulobacteraceae bacterium]|nr:GntR family transcriptional regulator [Caulobacteraceae bacterium]